MRPHAEDTVVSDLAGDARHQEAGKVSSPVAAGIEKLYEALTHEPRYAHFVKIADRIIRCLDYFEIAGDRGPIRTCLQSYYLFIGVVDDALDHGPMVSGERVLAALASPTPLSDRRGPPSTALLVTEFLRRHLPEYDRAFILGKFQELYEQVLNERAASAVEAYMECRIAVGAQTAELSYVLMRPYITGESEVLCSLMKAVGAVGCLVDSLIDLKSDYSAGLLAFTPTPGRYAKLLLRTIRLGLRISLRHPLLCLLFVQAIVDNIRDRFIRNQPYLNAPALVFDGKDQATSVA